MIHFMKLNPRPFSLIQNGRKTIELRLLDEKRRLISVGDTLVFSNTQDESATLSCAVKKLHVFKNFQELYQSLPLDKCGYLPQDLSTASAKDMEEYYSLDEQSRYGVVGIEIQLL